MRRGSPDLRNFYPRPPRGGRRRQPVQWPRRFSISIHALREEGDLPLGRNETARKISIHALREEGDVREDSQRRKDRNFYPRPPRGGRRLHAPSFRRCYRISIHALREEGDLRRQHPVPSHMRFLSTPSARRATVSVSSGSSRVSNFYPRPPRGGRRCQFVQCVNDVQFLSTPSARRATLAANRAARRTIISIHALREEGDPGRCRSGAHSPISIHALREEGDAMSFFMLSFSFYFYPRPPRGGRLALGDFVVSLSKFLSTPSARRATVDGDTRTAQILRFLSTPSARRATSTA